MTHRIVLASASPRRRELLERLGVRFEVIAADVDEAALDCEDPCEYVRRLSVAKAAAVAGAVDAEAVVIAADTTVTIDGRILAKPVDDADARRMLTLLGGRAHLVHTGVTVRAGARIATGVATTEVRFAPIDDASLEWYVATGEHRDKAGAYAIQGAADVFVAGVEGSVSNVIGLPLALTIALGRGVGVDLLRAG